MSSSLKGGTGVVGDPGCLGRAAADLLSPRELAKGNAAAVQGTAYRSANVGTASIGLVTKVRNVSTTGRQTLATRPDATHHLDHADP